MTLEELKHFIERSGFLTSVQKERILKLLPHLSVEDLRQLAAVLSEGAETLGKMKSTNQEQVTRLTQLFTAMNKHAIKLSKKDAYDFIEKDEKSDDKLDQILNQLNNA